MAEPISIAASACGIATLCGTIIVNVSRFVVAVNEQKDSLSEFAASISTLKQVLENVEKVVKQRPRQLPFLQRQERRHEADIRKILQACERVVYKLKNELPETSDETRSGIERARIQISLTLRSNVFVELRQHLVSYTQVLQLSLTTMTLGSILRTQQSQEQVETRIQSLTSEIQATNNLLRQDRLVVEPAPGDDLAHEELSKTRNIEAWRESAEQLAAAVTVWEPDDYSINERVDDDNCTINRWASGLGGHTACASEPFKHQGAHIDLDNTTSLPDSAIEVDQAEVDDGWEPEFLIEHCLGKDILEHQIKANQRNVHQFINSGLLSHAESYQKKGIQLQHELERTYGVPFSTRKEAEEILADTLIKQGKRDSLKQAKEILQKLVSDESNRDSGSKEDLSRQWRIYHKLAAIYIEFNLVAKAKKLAIHALGGRRSQVPMEISLVHETAKLLIRACQLNKDFDEAEGIRKWLHEFEGGQTENPPSDPAMVDLLQWCQGKGFNVHSQDFHFDQKNNGGKTPLHVAVSDEKLDIVKQLVDHVKTLDTRDSDDRTPLLLACATRNRRTTEVLLAKGAKSDVLDKYEESALHRVQSASGGIFVTELLLNHPRHGIDINHANNDGYTPLHLACRLGNEPMVALLIARGADVNSRGSATCTPLHVAIHYRRIEIVRKLLESGADTMIQDGKHQDAAAAARAAPFVSPDIRKLIQSANQQRWNRGMPMRRMSHASASTVDEPSSPRTRTSVASTSEFYRRDTSATLVEDLDQVAKVPSISSIQRKETVVLQASASASSSGLAGFDQMPSSMLDKAQVKTSKTSRLFKAVGMK